MKHYICDILILLLAATVFVLVMCSSVKTAGAAEIRPKLAFFTADWCEACQTMKSVLQADVVKRELKNFEVIVVDIDKNPDIVENYHVNLIPTFVKVIKREKNDKVEYEFIRKVGLIPETDFANWLKER